MFIVQIGVEKVAHFTGVCLALVTRLLGGKEFVDFVLIQILLLFICKSWMQIHEVNIYVNCE